MSYNSSELVAKHPEYLPIHLVQCHVQCEVPYVQVPSFSNSVLVALKPRMSGKFLAADNSYFVFNRILT
jgi:hypothetical protein